MRTEIKPSHCDFCDQPTPPDLIHPDHDEGWICQKCLGAQERAATEGGN